MWHGTADGVAAGEPYGLRVHGPCEPGRGVRRNPAKLLVDPWTRRVEGSVTSLAAALAFDGTDPFSARPDDHDSAGSVPPSVVTAPAGARTGRASRGAVAGHGDLRDCTSATSRCATRTSPSTCAAPTPGSRTRR